MSPTEALPPVEAGLIPIPVSQLAYGAGSCGLMPATVKLVRHHVWGLAGVTEHSVRNGPAPGSGPQQPDVGKLVKVAWPRGWAARAEGDELVLVDEERSVVAYEGDVVYLGGSGSVSSGQFWMCSLGGIQRNGEWIEPVPGYEELTGPSGG